MANYNKITVNNKVVLDLSSDKVTEDKVLSGVTFHDAAGAAKTGIYVPPEGVALPTLSNEGAAADLLTGKQLINQDGEIVEGTMPNNGTISTTFDGISTKSYTIPAGYTSGGTVSLDNTIDNEVTEQTDLIAQIAAAVDELPEANGTASNNLKIAYLASSSLYNSHTIIFEQGMTWADFCNSTHNIRYWRNSGYQEEGALLCINGNTIWDGSNLGYAVFTDYPTHVTTSDEIVENYIYEMHFDD